MKQAYLSQETKATIRVRVTDEQAFLTIKGPTEGIRRSEFEYEIPRADGEQMLTDLAVGAVIDKVRYEVPYAGHVWEVDVFHGDNQGLVVAEIELGSEEETFELPDWVAEEVSHDRRYFNASLAKHPYCDW
jgi:adenylate cyclase